MTTNKEAILTAAPYGYMVRIVRPWLTADPLNDQDYCGKYGKWEFCTIKDRNDMVFCMENGKGLIAGEREFLALYTEPPTVAASPSVQGESIDSLPPLPKPSGYMDTHYGWGVVSTRPGFSIDQMHAYVIADRLARTAAPSGHPDDLAVDRFAAAMKAKMAKQRGKGYSGWDDLKNCTDEHLADQLMRHAHKGDPVDIGNFAMMLHQRHDGDNYIVRNVLTSAALGFARRVASMFVPKAAPSEGLAIPTWQERMRDPKIVFGSESDCMAAEIADLRASANAIHQAALARTRAPATEQAKPESIKGKLREPCTPEDFGVPAQWVEAARNYANFLAAQPVPQASGERDAVIDEVARLCKALEALHLPTDPQESFAYGCAADEISALKSAATTSKPTGELSQSTGMRCTICCAKAGDPHVPGCSDAPVPRSVEDAMMVLNAERARRWVHRGPDRRQQQTESVPNMRQGLERRKP